MNQQQHIADLEKQISEQNLIILLARKADKLSKNVMELQNEAINRLTGWCEYYEKILGFDSPKRLVGNSNTGLKIVK